MPLATPSYPQSILASLAAYPLVDMTPIGMSHVQILLLNSKT